MKTRNHALSAAAFAATLMTAGFAYAQQPAVENPSVATPAPAPTTPAVSKGSLGLGQIEALLQRQGIRVQELEVRDHVVEVEGHDATNRKVEVTVDRRSG
ncbi:MAG: hypothetical protein ABW106_00865, partial [Steroidobacteraceae bacterium]